MEKTEIISLFEKLVKEVTSIESFYINDNLIIMETEDENPHTISIWHSPSHFKILERFLSHTTIHLDNQAVTLSYKEYIRLKTLLEVKKCQFGTQTCLDFNNG